MKSDYITRAIKFYNMIAKDIEYFDEVSDYEDFFHYFNRAYHRKVRVAHGCARIALITSDYVIKIDCGSPDYYGGCEDELRAYNYALKWGYEDIFAPITKIAHGVYVMPRCHVNEYNDIWHPYICCDTDKFYKKLTVEERGFVRNYIHDIHNGNIGLWHRRIVLVDYAANVCP